MNGFQAIADRVEIEALRGEFTDAVMMCDYDRIAVLFTRDGVLRMPHASVELNGRDEIRAGLEHLEAPLALFVQTTHPGTIHLDGDVATGRVHLQEVIQLRDGRSHLNYATYHDRYQRTTGGWKLVERTYGTRHVEQPIDPANEFAVPAPEDRLELAAAALRAHGFMVDILDDATAARPRIQDLVPVGARVFTGASETLRLSGIDDDLNNSGRYESIRARILALDRVTQADEIRQLLASPDVVVGSVAAVTETGSLVAASASGSQLPAYAGGAGRAIWVAGAQKVVPDLSTALRRLEEYVLPLESARAQIVYGQPSAINRLLILNAEPHPDRGNVLLLREAIGF